MDTPNTPQFSLASQEDEDALMQKLNPNELRMLALLGNGVPQEIVASTCGVTPAYVSQLMAQEGFKNLVAKLRYEKLQAQSSLDDNYDTMESQVQQKMMKMLPMIHKPRELLDFATRLNQMKRRNQGSLASQSSGSTAVTINLQLPTAILNKITVDPNTNRVIEANGQEMITLPSTNMAGALNDSRTERSEGKIRIPGRTPSASDL